MLPKTQALAGLSVQRMGLAEAAILAHLETIRIVFFVLHRVVVTLFALRTGHCHLYAHCEAPPWQIVPFYQRYQNKIAQDIPLVNENRRCFLYFTTYRNKKTGA